MLESPDYFFRVLRQTSSLVPRPSPLTRTFTRRDRCACGQLKAGKAWSETSREIDVG